MTASYPLSDVLRAAAALDASDVYVTVGARPVVPVLGQVRSSDLPGASEDDVTAMAGAVMTDAHRASLREAGHADIAWRDPRSGWFRITISRQRGTVAIAARRVRMRVPSCEERHVPAAVADLALSPRGLILITGPTGSGKSTTLAAMVDHRNRTTPGHIITIEDPIEDLHEDQLEFVSERRVGTDAASVAAARASAVRQTPDVLVIGEMRDADSATSAVYVADTGYLVVSTVHAVTASQAIDRVLHVCPPYDHHEGQPRLSAVMVAIIGQRVGPRADSAGLVSGMGILRATPRVRELICGGERAGLRQAMSEGPDAGMQTFDDSLFALYRSGLMTAETAREAADSPNDLRPRLRGVALPGRGPG